MKIKLIILSIFGICYLLFAIPYAYAAVSCQPIYGGGQSCITSANIAVDKKVLNPQTNKFVDNLNINDPKYHPGFITTFQISVTNSSNNTISKIMVKDIFPQHVTFSSGPGKFDDKTKTLSFSIQDLKAQETKIFVIMGKVVNMDQLSINQGSVVCVVNQANAASNSDNFNQDNSQFCIEKKVPVTKGGFPVLSPVPVTSTPPTGSEALVLFSLIPIGLAGWFLRKKTGQKNRKDAI